MNVRESPIDAPQQPFDYLVLTIVNEGDAPAEDVSVGRRNYDIANVLATNLFADPPPVRDGAQSVADCISPATARVSVGRFGPGERRQVEVPMWASTWAADRRTSIAELIKFEMSIECFRRGRGFRPEAYVHLLYMPRPRLRLHTLEMRSDSAFLPSVGWDRMATTYRTWLAMPHSDQVTSPRLAEANRLYSSLEKIQIIEDGGATSRWRSACRTVLECLNLAELRAARPEGDADGCGSLAILIDRDIRMLTEAIMTNAIDNTAYVVIDNMQSRLREMAQQELISGWLVDRMMEPFYRSGANGPERLYPRTWTK